MNAAWVREVCLSFPQVTEQVQWGDNLVFKIGGKMFAVAALVPAGCWLSFKCSAEDYADLIERLGVIPAPYLARAHWVALEAPSAMPQGEVRQRLQQAYDLIAAKLPKKAKLPKTKTRS